MNNFSKIAYYALSFVFVSTQFAMAAPLVSYEAVYELVLSGEKPSQDISAANGTMNYIFKGDACEGYSTSFVQQLALTNMEGSVVTFLTHSQNFEDPKSKTFRFHAVTHKDGKLQREVDGLGTHHDDQTVLKLQLPKKADVTLGKGVLFSTEHLLKVLEQAQKGESFLNTTVFDGGDEGDKALETLSIIGKPTTRPLEEPLNKSFGAMKRWPVSLAFYDNKTQGEGTPAYTLKFDLLENGLSSNLVMDYGGFALKARLKELKILPATPCKAK